MVVTTATCFPFFPSSPYPRRVTASQLTKSRARGNDVILARTSRLKYRPQSIFVQKRSGLHNTVHKGLWVEKCVHCRIVCNYYQPISSTPLQSDSSLILRFFLFSLDLGEGLKVFKTVKSWFSFICNFAGDVLLCRTVVRFLNNRYILN